MAVNMKPASADTVRAWAAEQNWTDEFGRAPKDRGRLPTTLISEFDRAHKRNRLQYTPGYKDDTSSDQPTTSRNTGNTGNAGNTGRGNAGKEVATRSTSRNTSSTPAKTTTARATAPARQEAPERIRVQAQRVSEDVQAGLPVQSINVEDAIALLTSAAASRKKGDAPPALIAVYTLI